jgi:hypothetical protein
MNSPRATERGLERARLVSTAIGPVEAFLMSKPSSEYRRTACSAIARLVGRIVEHLNSRRSRG